MAKRSQMQCQLERQNRKYFIISHENSNFSLQRQTNIIYWAMQCFDKMK